MASSVSFKGDVFPPTFGYLEASNICSAVNSANPTWGVTLTFNGNTDFTFTSNNASYAELKAAVMPKLLHFKGQASGAASVGALAYAQGSNIFLSQGQELFLPHEAWHVVQQ